MTQLLSGTIPRQRVTAVLTEALASCCLVVLTAPLGYGKTTAAQQVAERSAKRTFSLPMRPGWRDNAEYLWNDACARLEEQGASRAQTAKLMGFPQDDAQLYHKLALCRECLAKTPTLLVIDDYQHVDAQEIDRFLTNLVREEIPGFNILLLSRTRPALPLEHLRLKNYAAVFDHELLAFSQEETRRLFDCAGERDHEVADLAHGFSLGWAAALRVCLQSHHTRGVPTPLGNINELVSETFFSAYTVEDQCLLLQLSVLEAFTPSEAAYLTQEDDAPSRLRTLHERNAFLHYSPGPDSYSIHALLRSYLLEKLGENAISACEPIDRSALYRRAGECCLRSGDYLQAMRHFEQAGEDGDLLRILRIFEAPGEGIFMLPAPETVAEIVKRIPWTTRCRCPVGYLGFIHRYMVRVDVTEAAAMLDEAEGVFLAPGRFPEETRRKIMGEIQLVRAVQSFNDVAAMCRCYENADMLLRGNSSMVDTGMFWTFNCPHSAFLYLKEPGTYEGLVKLVAEKLVHFQNISQGSNAGAIDLLAAERLLETGQTHKAPHVMYKAQYKASEAGQLPGIVAATFTLARHRLARGQTEGIYDLFDALREPLAQCANPFLLQMLDVCVGYIAGVCGDTERLPSWLLRSEPSAVRSNQAHAFSLVVRGKSIMTVKNWPRLEAFAEEAERRIAPLGCLFGRLHILLCKAVAASHLQQNNTALAEKYLLQALELAGPDGITTSLAEYGSHLYPLLQRLNNFHPERRDLVRVTRITKKYTRLQKKQTSSLTLHEMDIMEMVQVGASNRDIGTKLGITPGSAANSLSRIYAKLGVGSRVEAIHKWAHEPPPGMEGDVHG